MRDNGEGHQLTMTKKLDDLVVKHIQTAPNKRQLCRMPSFQIQHDTPGQMTELLRQLEKAESQTGPRRRFY